MERIAARDDVDILFPRHPNPALEGTSPANVRLLPALGLPAFVRLLERADLVLTDSGGVQEEAAALGKPVIILRDATERPEGLSEGAVLTGTDPERIVRAAEARLDGVAGPVFPSLAFGDGKAAARIVDGLLGRPVAEFRLPEPHERDRFMQIG